MSQITVQQWNGDAIFNKLVKQAKKALINLAYLIRDDAKINVRKDTLRLQNSISVNWSNSGKGRIHPSGKYAPKAILTKLYGNRIHNRDMVSVENDGVGEPAEEDGKFTVVIGSAVRYACIFNSHTRIQMDKGYKLISKIIPGDLVLTQTGEYHKVLKTISRPALEIPNLVEISCEYRKNSIHKLTVTEEHKILVYREGRNKWIEAKDLLLTDCIYSRKKLASNKGIYTGDKKLICLNCNKILLHTENFKFCSNKCKWEYWNEGNNPHIGMKRSDENKKNMSIAGKQKFEKYPALYFKTFKKFKERFPNGTSIEQNVKKLLLNAPNVTKFYEQYQIGQYFVDFYIPDQNKIIEADGSYWHQDQEDDIKRDAWILNKMLDVKILHIHFYDKRYSPELDLNPLPNVYYVSCNPGIESFVNPEVFELKKITNIRKWNYNEKELKKKGTLQAKVYDLVIDKVHSYYANGILVSNSHQEFNAMGRGKPYLRPALEKYVSLFSSNISIDFYAKGYTD